MEPEPCNGSAQAAHGLETRKRFLDGTASGGVQASSSSPERIVAALRARRRPVWYNALNEGHGYERKENVDVFQQTVMLFLQRFLGE